MREYPIVYHMAEDGAWPSIQARGLLSTAALVDLYNPDPRVRAEILETVRTDSIVLEHPEHGRAVIRDQGPLRFLSQSLTPGTTPQEYLAALNSRVFFWPTRELLGELLGARRYRDKPQTVLQVDTADLIERHGDVVQLAPYNTGDLYVPGLPARGADVFINLDNYADGQPRSQGEAVVELTVPYAVTDISQLVTRVDRWHGGMPVEVLYER